MLFSSKKMPKYVQQISITSQTLQITLMLLFFSPTHTNWTYTKRDSSCSLDLTESQSEGSIICLRACNRLSVKTPSALLFHQSLGGLLLVLPLKVSYCLLTTLYIQSLYYIMCMKIKSFICILCLTIFIAFLPAFSQTNNINLNHFHNIFWMDCVLCITKHKSLFNFWFLTNLTVFFFCIVSNIEL